MDINLPVINLFKRQYDLYKKILSHSKNYGVIMAHRRWGKTLQLLLF
jgi:phage terminase small subunit